MEKHTEGSFRGLADDVRSEAMKLRVVVVDFL